MLPTLSELVGKVPHHPHCKQPSTLTKPDCTACALMAKVKEIEQVRLKLSQSPWPSTRIGAELLLALVGEVKSWAQKSDD